MQSDFAETNTFFMPAQLPIARTAVEERLHGLDVHASSAMYICFGFVLRTRQLVPLFDAAL